MFTRLVPDLKIVVIESPYDTLSQPIVQQLFPKLMQLKIQGYQSVYPYGVLPIDTYDFIATHQLICRETKAGYEILMGVKYITYERCLLHRLPFSGVALLRSSGATQHERVLESLLTPHKADPKKVSYGSSWTTAPAARDNKILKNTLKQLMTATLVHYETEIETKERFCFGVPKVKTDLYFEDLGYQRLCDGKVPLPPFTLSSLLGESVVMLRCTNFNDKAFQVAEHYRDLWESRLVLRSKDVAQKIQEAA